MAKLDIDPVLEQLVHAVNESGQARVPITVAAHGTLVSGVLIAHKAYFVSWPKAARCSARCSQPRACSARNTPRRSTPRQPATSTSARMPGRRGCGG
jgi:hypothetical protein